MSDNQEGISSEQVDVKVVTEVSSTEEESKAVETTATALENDNANNNENSKTPEKVNPKQVSDSLNNAFNTNTNNNTPGNVYQGINFDAHHAVQRVNYKDDTISIAAAKGNLPVCVLLWGMASAQKVNLMTPDRDGNNPLHYGAISESVEVLNFFLSQTAGLLAPGVPLVTATNADGETALLRAACVGHLPVLQCLLDNGSSLLATDDNGNTCLHNAARNGHLWTMHFLLGYAERQGCYDQLLQAKDIDDHRALEWAVYNGHMECMRYLIVKGLDPKYLDRRQRNCAHWAFKQSHAQVGKYLVVKEKVDFNIKDTDNKSAMEYACLTYKGTAAMSEALIAIKAPISEVMEATAQKNRIKNGIAIQGDLEMTSSHEDCLESGSQKGLSHGNKASDGYANDRLGPPQRLNQTRVSFLLLYMLVTVFLWGMTFIVPWWSWFIVLLIACFWWKNANALIKNDAYSVRDAEFLRQFIFAPEKLLGFWLGCVVTTSMVYPCVYHWTEWTNWTPKKDLVEHDFPEIGVESHLGICAILFYSFSLVALVAWTMLVLIDPNPGAIATRDHDYEIILEECAQTMAEPDSKKFCKTCFMKKPLRSKHCSICGFCTARMDHHCVWLNNCVGIENHRRFMFFVYAHWISIINYSIIVITILHTSVTQEVGENADLCNYIAILFKRPNFALLLQCMFAISVTIGMSMLCIEQTLNMMFNITTNERINRKRYSWLTNMQGRFQNRFDRGKLMNCMEFWNFTSNKPDYFRQYSLPGINGGFADDVESGCKSGEHGGHNHSHSHGHNHSHKSSTVV